MDGPFDLSTLRISPSLLQQIAEIDEFKGAWKAIGRIEPESLARLRHVATIESIGSSTRIEGARLSDREVETLLGNLELRAWASRDEQEVAGYAAAMEMVFDHAASLALSENHIRHLHMVLLQHSDKDTRHRGSYKTLANHVEARGPDGEHLGVVFATATPFETPRRMEELVAWTNAHLGENHHHPLLIVAIFVVVFLEIHPFQDGNGRLSRILTTLLLLRTGYAYVPFGSLESVVERTKEDYYRALRHTQSTLRSGPCDWQPWLDYFARILLEQKRHVEAKLLREHLLLGDLPELSAAILQLARERGRVTTAEIVTATGANRNTVKEHLRSLTLAQRLARHGAGRGTWYSLG